MPHFTNKPGGYDKPLDDSLLVLKVIMAPKSQRIRKWIPYQFLENHGIMSAESYQTLSQSEYLVAIKMKLKAAKKI